MLTFLPGYAYFALAGLIAGISGILYSSYLGSMSENFPGGQYVLYSVAGAVIGGVSLFGGRGRLTGAVLGGALGLLAGIGALAIPGVGPLIAAGPIMATLAGLGVGGAVGGVTGALIGLGIPEYEAKRYEGRIKEGGILLSVHCDTSDQIKRAKDIMKVAGAEDISSTGESSADVKASRVASSNR